MAKMSKTITRSSKPMGVDNEIDAKNLDPAYKMALEFLDFFRRWENHLMINGIWYVTKGFIIYLFYSTT